MFPCGWLWQAAFPASCTGRKRHAPCLRVILALAEQFLLSSLARPIACLSSCKAVAERHVVDDPTTCMVLAPRPVVSQCRPKTHETDWFSLSLDRSCFSVFELQKRCLARESFVLYTSSLSSRGTCIAPCFLLALLLAAHGLERGRLLSRSSISVILVMFGSGSVELSCVSVRRRDLGHCCIKHASTLWQSCFRR